MRIKKGQLLRVSHRRRGEYIAKAKKDFNTIKSIMYPLELAQKKPVHGMSSIWEEGDDISAGPEFCSVTPI